MFSGGCGPSLENDGFYVLSQVYDFQNGSHGWQGDFAEYSVSDSILCELKFEHTDLPPGVGSGKALTLSGNNKSGDLFMFLKKKIGNLSPNTEYAISFEISYATNNPRSPLGGNSTGESIFLKAGAFHEEPMKVNVDGYYLMNLDKGNQSARGIDMIVIAPIYAVNSDGVSYALETRNNISSFTARTNQNGELWIIVGTDSGFEGSNTIFYTKINLALTASV